MEQLLGSDFKLMIIAGARLLENNKEMINAMNTFPVPDGDTGTNMSLTMRSALAEVQKVNTDSIGDVAAALATGSLLGARGNSGVILSQIFRGFAKGLEGKHKVTPKEFAAAMQSGVQAAYKAVMKPVEGTMLTIARESAKAAISAANRGTGFKQMLQDVVEHAEAVLAKTPDMLPVLKEAGVVDAGGRGLIDIYTGFLLQLLGEEIPEAHEIQETKLEQSQDVFHTEEIEFGYCTELIIRGEKLDPEKIRREISVLGDSVLSVGDSQLVKVHIHTNNPGLVLEKCIAYGTLHDIKIDNMRDQHTEILNIESEPEPQVVEGIAVVAVANGDGLTEIFNSLGVDKIIHGGQSMNPSTEDLLQAVKEVPQNKVIILPNNKNIILSAKQVCQLSDKDVRVVESRSIPQGIAAMLAYIQDEALEKNVENMEAARQKVKSAAVTYAVCDSKVNGMEIKKNDIIGLIEDDIIACGNNVEQIVKDLLFKMVDDETEVITLYAGEAVPMDTAETLQNEIESLFAEYDVELYEGGQPHYFYILSVE
ncbi:MAG: DAK2 domain-containing protein [Firmicutes bacterium]|nr:DAK2 domain-containing protein [Bacillota bacterium]